jgi:integrase
MPKRIRNLVRKPGRTGWYFRRKVRGRTTWLALGTDYEEASRRVRKLRLSDDLKESDLTVGVAAEQWLASYVATARNVHGQKLAAQRVRDFLTPHLGPTLISRVRAEDLRRYRLALEKGSLSVQSVAHILSDARCLFGWLEDSGLIDRSPVPRRLLPRIQERPPARLSDEEVTAVCAVRDPYGFICRFLVSSGLRWGEFTRLQASDVQGGVALIHRTKSGRVRRVPLPPETLAELKGRVGKLTALTDAQGVANVVRRQAGVGRFHVHQLRHSFACRWIESGGSLAALQEILGHASIVTTQRYGRIGQDVVEREAARLYGQRVPIGVPKELQQNS